MLCCTTDSSGRADAMVHPHPTQDNYKLWSIKDIVHTHSPPPVQRIARHQEHNDHSFIAVHPCSHNYTTSAIAVAFSTTDLQCMDCGVKGSNITGRSQHG